MKIVKIEGELWKLSRLWFGSKESPTTDLADEVNRGILNGRGAFDRGTFRLLAPGIVRAAAFVTIEIEVNGLPRQEVYDIYYTKKGYYTNAQGTRVYLHELEWIDG